MAFWNGADKCHQKTLVSWNHHAVYSPSVAWSKNLMKKRVKIHVPKSSFNHYLKLFTCSVLSFFERLCSPATTLTSFCWHFPSVKVRKSQKNFFLSSNITQKKFLQISAMATKKWSNEKKILCFTNLISQSAFIFLIWTLFGVIF